jgi:hypothetical protein
MSDVKQLSIVMEKQFNFFNSTGEDRQRSAWNHGYIKAQQVLF